MVDNQSKWGRAKARERYGSMGDSRMVPSDKEDSYPQKLGDKNNLRAPGNEFFTDTTPRDWRVGAPNDSAEGKPSFDKTGAGQKR